MRGNDCDDEALDVSVVGFVRFCRTDGYAVSGGKGGLIYGNCWEVV